MLIGRASFLVVTSVFALVACSSGSTGTTSGEGSGEGKGASGGPTGDAPSLGTPIEGTSSGETASGGSSSGQDPASSSGTSGTSGTSGSSGSSGTSGTSGTTSTPPRAECVAWANRHCTCLENAGAAAANCRTTTAKSCDDAVRYCPAILSWYVCSQTTCGNTCPKPSC